jgi:hypothetical protein
MLYSLVTHGGKLHANRQMLLTNVLRLDFADEIIESRQPLVPVLQPLRNLNPNFGTLKS